MKKCSYCGQENKDGAQTCSQCGKEFRTETPSELGPWDRIAILRNEAEAERLDVELDNRQIPHVLTSYADSALDGIYQKTHGWGQVEAPQEHKQTVLAILEDMRLAAAAEPEEAREESAAAEKPTSAPETEPAGPRKLCVSCRASIPESALLCPRCGYTQPEVRSTQSSSS